MPKMITVNLCNVINLYSQASAGRQEDISQAINNINRDLEFIKSCSMRFGLSVIPTKCQVISIGSKNMVNPLDTTSVSRVVFNGLFMPWSDVIKDLGLFIDSTLD